MFAKRVFFAAYCAWPRELPPIGAGGQVMTNSTGINSAASSTDPITDQKPTPLLLTAKQAAPLCGKSLRTWRSWDSAGFIPRPVRIGRSTFWRAEELKAWVAAGCPCRAEWEART